jgi:hypothetical protein
MSTDMPTPALPRHTVSTFALGVLAVASACATQGREASPSPAAKAAVIAPLRVEKYSSPSSLPDVPLEPVVRRAVRPGVETRLSIPVAQSTTCYLYGDTRRTSTPQTEERAPLLQPDDFGEIHFHVAPRSASAVSTMLLDCETAAGVRRKIPIEVRGDPNAAPQPSAMHIESLPVRRALTPEEQTSRTDQDLAAAGYPPRPNAKASAAAHAHWVEMVSRPWSMVPGTLAPMRRYGASSGPYTPNNIWAGAVSPNPVQAYQLVWGTWNVPALFGGDPTGYAGNLNSFTWVGIGGGGSVNSTIIQTGSFQAIVVDVEDASQAWDYSALVEYLPGAAQRVKNLPVNPEDTLTAIAWSCDANWNQTATGAYGCFQIYNATQSVAVPAMLQNPGATFDGSTVEWIEERPAFVLAEGISPLGFTPMPRFNEFSMTNLYGQDASSDDVVGRAQLEWMVNATDNDTLVSAFLSAVASSSDPTAEALTFTSVNEE